MNAKKKIIEVQDETGFVQMISLSKKKDLKRIQEIHGSLHCNFSSACNAVRLLIQKIFQWRMDYKFGPIHLILEEIHILLGVQPKESEPEKLRSAVSLDRLSLKIMYAAIKEEKFSRALDLARQLRNVASYDTAIKMARSARNEALVENIFYLKKNREVLLGRDGW